MQLEHYMSEEKLFNSNSAVKMVEKRCKSAQTSTKCRSIILKFGRAPDWPHCEIFDMTPHEGGPDQPHTPEMTFFNMALEWPRPMQFYSLI